MNKKKYIINSQNKPPITIRNIKPLTIKITNAQIFDSEFGSSSIRRTRKENRKRKWPNISFKWCQINKRPRQMLQYNIKDTNNCY